MSDELIYYLTFPTYMFVGKFVGKKPIAVIFDNETICVKTWREVYSTILKRCNADPKCREKLLYLRNKTSGKCRKFLSDKPDGMTRAVKIDDDMYGEVHYGSATLMHILTLRILAPAGFDYSNIKIIINN